MDNVGFAAILSVELCSIFSYAFPFSIDLVLMLYHYGISSYI